MKVQSVLKTIVPVCVCTVMLPCQAQQPRVDVPQWSLTDEGWQQSYDTLGADNQSQAYTIVPTDASIDVMDIPLQEAFNTDSYNVTPLQESSSVASQTVQTNTQLPLSVTNISMDNTGVSVQGLSFNTIDTRGWNLGALNDIRDLDFGRKKFDVKLNVWAPLSIKQGTFGYQNAQTFGKNVAYDVLNWMDDVSVRFDAKSKRSRWELLAYTDSLNTNPSAMGVGFEARSGEVSWVEYLLARALRSKSANKNAPTIGFSVAPKAVMFQKNTDPDAMSWGSTSSQILGNQVQLHPSSNATVMLQDSPNSAKIPYAMSWDIKSRSALVQRRLELGDLQLRLGAGLGYKRFSLEYENLANKSVRQMNVQGFHPALRISANYPLANGYVNAHMEGYSGSKGYVYDWALSWSRPAYKARGYQASWSVLVKGAAVKMSRAKSVEGFVFDKDSRFSSTMFRAGLDIEFR